MTKRIATFQFRFIIVIGLCLLADTAIAENEAVFDLETWELNIPKVIVGSDAYEVNLKLSDKGFLIVDVKSNKVSASIWGTYTYNSTTGALGVDFAQTTFKEGQGPPLGFQATTITSMTDTHLIIKDQQGDVETWQRISGSGKQLSGKWLMVDKSSENVSYVVEFSGGNSVTLTREHSFFVMQKKTISIDGNFNDWAIGDRVYIDTNGPECGNVAGRDLKEVYVAYDDHFTYVRFVLNGPPDTSFGYKFGGLIHANVENRTLMYASGTLLPYGIHFPDHFLAISGNQIEYKIPSLHSWQGQQVNAWLDQGSDTICRDEVSLPILVRK